MNVNDPPTRITGDAAPAARAAQHATESKTQIATTDYAPWFPKNLWRRLLSASILIPLTLGLLYAGPKVFAVLVILIAIMMSWEWGRLVRVNETDPIFMFHGTAVTLAAVAAAMGLPVVGLIMLAVGTLGVLLTSIPNAKPISSASGVLYIGLPTIALLWFRSDAALGFAAVLYIFTVAWAADTAAYLGGRSIGGPKLWPAVSPKKTWAGFITAILSAGLIGAVAAFLLAHENPTLLILTSIGFGIVSQMGDLVESALKRGFGVKDSSDLIPGHGGFLDRMDSVVAVALVAALVALLYAPSSAPEALLFLL